MSIEVREEQSPKAAWPISVTEDGMVIDASSKQPRKASPPILVRDDPRLKVTDVREEQ
jgi:hypothetical protein